LCFLRQSTIIFGFSMLQRNLRKGFKKTTIIHEDRNNIFYNYLRWALLVDDDSYGKNSFL